MNKFTWEYSKAGLSIPKGCRASQHHWTKQDFGVCKVEREKSLYLYPNPGPQAARTPQARIQTKRKEAGALLGRERQGFGRRAHLRQPGRGERGRPPGPRRLTRMNGKRAKTTTRPGKPPSLSRATLVVLFLLTIATAAAVVGKCCRILAADATLVRSSGLK